MRTKVLFHHPAHPIQTPRPPPAPRPPVSLLLRLIGPDNSAHYLLGGVNQEPGPTVSLRHRWDGKTHTHTHCKLVLKGSGEVNFC